MTPHCACRAAAHRRMTAKCCAMRVMNGASGYRRHGHPPLMTVARVGMSLLQSSLADDKYPAEMLGSVLRPVIRRWILLRPFGCGIRSAGWSARHKPYRRT